MQEPPEGELPAPGGVAGAGPAPVADAVANNALDEGGDGSIAAEPAAGVAGTEPRGEIAEVGAPGVTVTPGKGRGANGDTDETLIRRTGALSGGGPPKALEPVGTRVPPGSAATAVGTAIGVVDPPEGEGLDAPPVGTPAPATARGELRGGVDGASCCCVPVVVAEAAAADDAMRTGLLVAGAPADGDGAATAAVVVAGRWMGAMGGMRTGSAMARGGRGARGATRACRRRRAKWRSAARRRGCEW